jgi:hypothetical protein
VENSRLERLLRAMERWNPSAGNPCIKLEGLLRDLVNDRHFLAERFIAELRNLLRIADTPTYAPHSFLLAVKGSLVLRANIWVPINPQSAFSGQLEQLFSYNLAHDHNFDLLTVGYSGPGYKTDIFEYDRASLKGELGERVYLESRGQKRLEMGSTIYYRRSRDIHIQYPPDSLSVTINLIWRSESEADSEQFAFDTKKNCVAGYVASAVSRKVSLVRMAAQMKDARVNEALRLVSVQAPAARLRAEALLGRGRIGFDDDASILSEALRDPDPLVRDVVPRLVRQERR